MTRECELPQGNPPADEIRAILAAARRIAVVGHSDDPVRDSYQVGRYLAAQGYEVFAVNPVGRPSAGLTFYPNLAAVPAPIDIVNIFRRAEFIPEIVDQAIAIGAKVVWMQDGLAHAASAAKARAAGLEVVQNRCIMRDHARLG